MKFGAQLIAKVEEALGVNFTDKDLLLRALTHRSFVKEEPEGKDQQHNETLEFLGDAVLSLVAAEEAFAQRPHANEGGLTQIRAAYVCQANLVEAAKRCGVGAFMRVGRTMRTIGPVELPSPLSDVMEAIIGAAYLDGGYQTAKELTLRLLGPLPDKAPESPKDAKTELQELVQAASSPTPVYTVVSTSGPSHAPVFTMDVAVAGKVVARGSGSSKKEAAQDAARAALKVLIP